MASNEPFGRLTPAQRARWFRELESNYADAPNCWHVGYRYPTVTAREFIGIERRLRQVVGQFGREGFRDDCDAFVVDQWYGDRTAKIEIINSAIVTRDFLRAIRQALKPKHQLWRIVVSPVFASKFFLWVYPSRIQAWTNNERRVLVSKVLKKWGSRH